MNEKNKLDIEGLHAQLEKWHGSHICIKKDELRDVDEIRMELNSISYDKNTRKLDNYQSLYTLHLNGTGSIQTDRKEQPLPDAVYDIPLEDTASYKMNGSALQLHTTRGTYEIRPDGDPNMTQSG
ncbi:hypothetical protein ACFSMW_08405 [Virgibacillus halophilus]|uniref:Uncharacterized protein n=1 Tax=Tigheibacillus halophilus TaxID=361280 RepID=A0ABU5C6E3_9BACI|nr:hypothetical protein [Virgibacillus halophilus]